LKRKNIGILGIMALMVLILVSSVLGAVNIELILDASESMRYKIEGEAKIDIAKETLIDFIIQLPDEANVGLRVYGADPIKACQDTELLVPIQPKDQDLLIRAIQVIEPGAMTPIAFSLEQAEQDFQDLPGENIVVLLSDGHDTCDGDPVMSAETLLGAGISVHVIGFGIAPLQREQLEDIATYGGGKYYGAEDAAELAGSFQEIKEEIATEKSQSEEIVFLLERCQESLSQQSEMLIWLAKKIELLEGRVAQLEAVVGQAGIEEPPVLPEVGITRILLHFDEGEGKMAYDDSSHRNNGEIWGAVWVSGLSGYALAFDGSDDLVRVEGTGLDGLGDMTCEFWVKTVDRGAGLISGANPETPNECVIYINSAKIICQLKGRTAIGSGKKSIVDDSWHHIAMTREGSLVKTYIDGLVDREVKNASPDPLVISPTGLYLGVRQQIVGGGFKSWFAGVIDELAVYDRALSHEEILDHYRNKRAQLM